MLRDAWRSLKLVVFVLRSLRRGFTGAFMVITAALFIVPPTQAEQQLLVLQTETTARNEALIMHRIAKLVTHFDSDALYSTIVAADPNGMDAETYRLMVEGFATGRVQVPAGANLFAGVVDNIAGDAPAPPRLTQGEHEAMQTQLRDLVTGPEKSYADLIAAEGRPLGELDLLLLLGGVEAELEVEEGVVLLTVTILPPLPTPVPVNCRSEVFKGTVRVTKELLVMVMVNL